jgi:hypothetical protein
MCRACLVGDDDRRRNLGRGASRVHTEWLGRIISMIKSLLWRTTFVEEFPSRSGSTHKAAWAG